MKKQRLLLFFLLLTLLLGLFTSCLTQARTEAPTPELEARCAEMLDSIIEGDYDTFYSNIKGACGEDEARELFPQMQDYLDGVTTYELKLHYIATEIDDGVRLRMEQYIAQTDCGDYLISLTTSSETESLVSFRVIFEEDMNENGYGQVTGTVTTMRDASALQWVILLIGFLEIVWICFSVVDCARHRISHKAMWIVLIVFATISVVLTFSDGTSNIRFNYGLFFSYTSLVTSSSGAVQATLLVPVGTILYWCRRKKLLSAGSAQSTTPDPLAESEHFEITDDSQDGENGDKSGS